MAATREPQAPVTGDEAPPGTPATGEAPCATCRGTGRRDGEPCPTCGGSGRIIEGVGGA